MPAALGVSVKFPHLREVQPAWIVGGATLLLLGVGATLLGNTNTAVAGGAVRPLYPTEQSPVEMIDVPNLTVQEVVQKLPIGLRFSLLLTNSGVMHELEDTGRYTLFVPADNYFDYLPKGEYIKLTKAQSAELAQNHIAVGIVELPQALSDNYIILKAYKAKNGVVYVTNKVLVPDDLKDKLQ